MKRQAIHKLLDLAKRLPSIEILNTAEVTPLLEAVRAIKAAEVELKAACDCEPEDEALAHYWGGKTAQPRLPEPASQSLSLSF